MNNFFKFQLNTKVISGVNSTLDHLPQLLDDNKFKSILILVDEGVYNHSDYYKQMVNSLQKREYSVETIILRGNEEPDYTYVDEVATEVRKKSLIDVIIGIGGGSTMDVAKAAAALAKNPGKAIIYRGFDQLTIPNIPTVEFTASLAVLMIANLISPCKTLFGIVTKLDKFITKL